MKAKIGRPEAIISHSLSAWATNIGTDRRTLERQLIKSGYVLKAGEKIEAKAIDRARVGEMSEAAIRLKNAQAEDQERKNRIADGEMIPLSDNLAWQDKVLMPIRQRLLALAGTMGHLCNPTDPKHAQDQLDRWTNETLPMLRAEIGKK